MTTKKTTDRLLGEMRHAYDLVQERRPGEAVQLYRALLAEAGQVGLDSAHLQWADAVVCDYSGDPEMAFEQMTTVTAKDPLAPPFRLPFELITGRIESPLCDAGRAADDPSTSRLYALLSRADEADVGAHLATARYLLATGNAEQARTPVAAATRRRRRLASRRPRSATAARPSPSSAPRRPEP